jgi:erythronate-4-phosphate dehydrogenase
LFKRWLVDPLAQFTTHILFPAGIDCMIIVADENIPFVQEAFESFGTVRCYAGRSITKEVVADATILLVRSITQVNRELLEGSAVKFVATATIGTDHIDLHYLAQQSIGFASAPGSNATSVAQYVMAAILHCCKVLGRDYHKQTLGIIGVGNVGTRVFRHAMGLGMRCVLSDPPLQRKSNQAVFRPLKQVLNEADIVTLHVPLTTTGNDSTLKMVGSDFLGQLKPGAILINSSRGKVVDENALKAVASKLGAVVLDVWMNEPQPDPQLVELTTIATPHIAGYSYDGKVMGTQMIYQAACAFFFRPVELDLMQKIQGEATILDASRVHDAVMQAYPLMEDDARFREILATEPAKRGAYFDRLRKEYPVRREFCNFQVTAPESQRAELAAIGFKIE